MHGHDSLLTGGVPQGLRVVLDEIEAAIGASIDLHMQSPACQGVGVQHVPGQGDYRARADEGRDLREGGGARQAPASLITKGLAGPCCERIPRRATRKVHVLRRVLADDGGNEDDPVHPLGCDARGLHVVRELHGQGLDPVRRRRIEVVRERVVVGHQPVSEPDGLFYHGLRGIAEGPWPVGLRPEDGVHPHDRHKHADLHPSREVRPVGLAVEAADVGADVRRAAQHPIQHHARRVAQVLPVRVHVSRPHRGADARHAGAPRSVQREEPPRLVHLVYRVTLRDVHVPERVVVRLALVIPPEVDAADIFARVVPHLVGVPCADRRDRVVQAPADGIVAVGRVAAARLRRRQDPPLLGDVP
mmetsp:Transcript_8064/g.22996  ORF Transcript_8064/g.22996 Transcript_8064/m.22996 type:complete len:360 (-) Transcript_8064:988-2067(-)